MKLIIALSFLSLVSCECNNFRDLSNYLGTKTPYRIRQNKNATNIAYPGCEASKIWMVVRHGTRYPNKKLIGKMRGSLVNLRDKIIAYGHTTNLCSGVKQKLREWAPGINVEDEKILTHEGEDEMIELGERMQLRFPDLMPDVYFNETFRFKFTDTQRTAASAKYFATGLFGRFESAHVWFPNPEKSDLVLRFYKDCNRWKKTVKNSERLMKENELFKESLEMKNAMKEISKILGLPDLTVDEAYIMYQACAFETAWFKREQSPWCAPFSEETIQAFEYLTDLQHFWNDGYGFELTYKQACPTIADLAKYFNETKKDPRATVYFTHSGTVLKLLSYLGLYKDDDKLTHANYKQQSNRTWRSSKIDSFGTNLAFVLYNCKGDQKKMLFLHNEVKMTLPICKEELCDFDAFLKHYHEDINNCSFHTMCKL